MFIRVTVVNGRKVRVPIGIRHIVLVEPYEQESEPDIHAIITLTNRVLNVTETAETIDLLLNKAQGIPPDRDTPF